MTLRAGISGTLPFSIPGIGHTESWTWPDLGSPNMGGITWSGKWGTRQNGSQTTFGVGGAINARQVKGVDCTELWGNNGGGESLASQGVMWIRQRVQQMAGLPANADYLGFVRLIGVMARGPGAAAVQAGFDCGLQLLQSISNPFFSGGTQLPGFAWQLYDDAHVHFALRGPNGTKEYDVTPLVAGWATTDWHCYELRIQKATAQNAGWIKILIDGSDVTSKLAATSRAWGAGSDLPTPVNSGGANGYSVCTISRPGAVVGGTSIYYHEVRQIQAANEAASL